MNEWFTVSSMQSFIGACSAVTLATRVVKALVPVSGRVTNFVAFAFSVAVVGVNAGWHTPSEVFAVLMNSFGVFAGAWGIYAGITAKSEEKK